MVRTTTTPYSAIPRAPNPVIIQTHLVFVRLSASRAPGTGTPSPLPPLAALAALAAAAAAAPSSAASTPTTAPAAAASAAAAAATRRRPRRVAPTGHNPQQGQKAGRGEERRGAGNRVRVRPSPEVLFLLPARRVRVEREGGQGDGLNFEGEIGIVEVSLFVGVCGVPRCPSAFTSESTHSFWLLAFFSPMILEMGYNKPI